MAAIFRQKYTARSPDGTRVTKETSKYYIEYRDTFGVIRRVPGLRDRKATEAMAAELERNAARAAAFGRSVVEANRPILAHVADYDLHLTALGVSDRWRCETLARIRWIIDHTRARRLADLTAVTIARPLIAVLDAGRSARTRDAYLLSTRSFLRWAVADHRLDSDLESISRMPLLNGRHRARGGSDAFSLLRRWSAFWPQLVHDRSPPPDQRRGRSGSNNSRVSASSGR